MPLSSAISTASLRVIVTRALNEADPDQLVTVLEAVFAAIIETPMA